MAVNLNEEMYKDGVNALTSKDTVDFYVQKCIETITEDPVNGVMIARKRLYNTGFSYALATTLLLIAVDLVDGDTEETCELKTQKEFLESVDYSEGDYGLH